MRYVTVLKHAKSQLAWQRAGLSQTASGYGSRLTTEHLVKIKEGRDQWYRVYAVCYSNAASFYVVVGRKRVFVRDSDLSV